MSFGCAVRNEQSWRPLTPWMLSADCVALVCCLLSKRGHPVGDGSASCGQQAAGIRDSPASKTADWVTGANTALISDGA